MGRAVDRSDAAAAAPVEASAAPATGRKRRRRVRPLVRSLHRDLGYLAIGLTIIYAVSGLAVNHIEDWDPNFQQIDAVHELPADLPAEDGALAAAVLDHLDIDEAPDEVFRLSDAEVSVLLPHRTLHIDTERGEVREEGQEPRLLLRAANWLHLNRGKEAWTYVADSYAVLLLVLAFSFMLPGRKGLLGRGGVLVIAGALVPILYVVWSGGP